VEPRVAVLEQLILGRGKSAELRQYLKYSLMGMAASPMGARFTEVENLIWLLGKYIERKGRETEASYVTVSSNA